MSTIRQLCERVIVLDHGRIAFDGDVEEGIDRYLNKKGSKKEISYDYSCYDRHPYYGRSVQMLGIDLIDMVSNTVVLGETVGMVLHCKAYTDVHEVGFRLEADYSDGALVGTTFLDKAFSASSGELFDLYINMPTDNFTPGIYNFIAVLSEKDKYGNQMVIDRVEPALTLEMEETDPESVWIHNWWGHVHFGDLILKDRKTIMSQNH